MLRLSADNVVRRVFIDRLTNYVNLREKCKLNECLSPTYDILNAATRFGVFSYICDMASGNSPIKSKSSWSKLMWNNAWRLEDAYWNSTKILYKDNELLQMALTCSRYLCWWELADKRPRLIRMCENMAKLVSHASRLRGDDVRLKGLTPSHRNCVLCDLYVTETLYHLAMQCPYFEEARIKMYSDLNVLGNRLNVLMNEIPGETFNYIIGKNIPTIENEMMLDIWSITGITMDKMYREVCRNRLGIV